MTAGSPPRSAHASRITAKSTNTGTPVKSCSSTRAGMNSTSAPFAPASPASTTRSASRRASVPVAPLRSTFSSSTVSEKGSFSCPSTAATG